MVSYITAAMLFQAFAADILFLLHAGIVQATQKAGGGQHVLHADSPIRVGAFLDGAFVFNGDIFNVLVYHAALSQAQLQYAISVSIGRCDVRAACMML